MPRLISAEVSNFKRVKLVQITPKRGLTVIGGNNAAGKSSVLDALISALAGDRFMPDVPLRKGEEHGHTVIEMDDCTIRKEYREGQKPKLIVTDKSGLAVQKPQMFLSQLFNGPKPDITEFLRMSGKEQTEKLREMLGIDTKQLDEARKSTFETRTIVNRDAKQIEGAMLKMEVFPDVPDYDVSISSLMAEIDRANSHNNDVQAKRRTRDDAQRRFESANAERLRLRAAYEAAVESCKVAQSSAQLAESEYAAVEETIIDTAPVRARIEQVSEINRKVAANRAHAEQQALYIQKKDEADQLTAEIAAIDAKKLALLGSVKFPVPGLGIEDETVTLNGFPLDQASSAEKLRACVLLYLAMEPKLRFIPVYDGSLFDDESLEVLAAICEEQNCDIFMERVGEGCECDVVIEDGTVKGSATE